MTSIRDLAIATLIASDSESEAEMISVTDPKASTTHNAVVLVSVPNPEVSTSRLKALTRDEKQYNCKVCGKSFSRKNYLERHTLTHTGVKPYNWALCKRGFSQKSHLERYSYIHTK